MRKYAEKKLDEVTTMMEKLVIGKDSKSEDSEIIRQLKEKIQSTSERSIQVQLLMILPQNWSIQKIETVRCVQFHGPDCQEANQRERHPLYT